ncbi:MAG TPA: DinB family protein, partial [Bryobacteraceae bacterium]|nr:DinB family protein [Bryobacteraceae bacterium]
ALVLAVAPLAAGSLTEEERDFAMSSLHASRKLFLDAIAGLSEAQWKFKPAPDRWSIAEVAEHITLTEGVLYNLVTDKVMKTEPVTDRAPVKHEQDEELLARMRDRSKKAKASEEMSPKGKFPTPAAAAEAFKQERDRNINYIQTTQDNLRSHVQGKMDAYQYFILIAGHAERHVAQMNEVKADPKYPR